MEDEDTPPVFDPALAAMASPMQLSLEAVGVSVAHEPEEPIAPIPSHEDLLAQVQAQETRLAVLEQALGLLN